MLALDPANALARVTLASRHLQFDWDWATAEREFRTVSSDPQLFLGTQYHAVALFFEARGAPQEGVALLERALRVDPGDLESRTMMADLLASSGRLDDALALYRAIAQSEPSDPRPHFGLGPFKAVKQLEVRWPSGVRQVLTDIPANQIHQIVEP